MANLLNNSTFNDIRITDLGSYTNIVGGKCAFNNKTTISGTKNTIFGYKTAYCASTNSTGNTAVGYRALGGFSPGEYDINCATAIGACAMACVKNINVNTGIGFRSLLKLEMGQNNVAVGSYSMAAAIDANDNVFVGYKAGCAMTCANNNTGIGACSLIALTTGCSNTAVGWNSLKSVTTGNSNIAIGYCAGYNVTTADNTIAIGYKSTTSNTSDHTAAGNSGCSTFCVGTSWTTLSDGRDKTDIETLPDNLGLNFIRKLRPVKYNFDFRDKYVRECNFTYGTKDGTLANEKESYGFIAQEMQNSLNELNITFDPLNYNSEEDHYRLAYSDLIAPIVKAIQDTLIRLETLENLVNQ